MSQIVNDAIARELAALGLERVVPNTQIARGTTGPGGVVPDLGFGRDLSCVGDVTPSLAEVEPYSPIGIGEATIRRLTTPRGTLPDDPDYGFDVRAYCNRGVSRQDLRDLGGLARAEATKDDRIEDVTVTLTEPARGELVVYVRITPANPAVESFALTFRVTSGAAVLMELG